MEGITLTYRKNDLVKLFCCLILGTCTASNLFSQAKPIVPNQDAQQAAAQGLSTLTGLIGENYSLFGLESSQQLTQLRLGTPISIYTVRLDALENYEPNSAASLLLDEHAFLYPVKVGPVPVTSFILEQTPKGWESTRLGDAVLGQKVSNSILESASADRIPVEQYFLVWIQAMHRYFVAHRNSDRILLKTIFADTELNLQPGTEKPADEWFQALKPLAEKYESPN